MIKPRVYDKKLKILRKKVNVWTRTVESHVCRLEDVVACLFLSLNFIQEGHCNCTLCTSSFRPRGSRSSSLCIIWSSFVDCQWLVFIGRCCLRVWHKVPLHACTFAVSSAVVLKTRPFLVPQLSALPVKWLMSLSYTLITFIACFVARVQPLLLCCSLASFCRVFLVSDAVDKPTSSVEILLDGRHRLTTSRVPPANFASDYAIPAVSANSVMQQMWWNSALHSTTDGGCLDLLSWVLQYMGICPWWTSLRIYPLYGNLWGWNLKGYGVIFNAEMRYCCLCWMAAHSQRGMRMLAKWGEGWFGALASVTGFSRFL